MSENSYNSTLQYYQQNADEFVEGTISADMHDARARFLKLLPPHAFILDFGCGSGRDAKAFLCLREGCERLLGAGIRGRCC